MGFKMSQKDYLWYMENKTTGTRIYFEAEHMAKSTYNDFPKEVKDNWIVASRNSSDNRDRRDH